MDQRKGLRESVQAEFARLAGRESGGAPGSGVPDTGPAGRPKSLDGQGAGCPAESSITAGSSSRSVVVGGGQGAAGVSGSSVAVSRVCPTSDNVSILGSHCCQGGGVDTLHVNLYGSWNRDKFHRWRQRFERCQEEAREGRAGMLPDGRGGVLKFRDRGFGKGAMHCKWAFEWCGVVVGIANHWEHDSRRVSVVVQVGSLALMECGHAFVWSQVCALLAKLGFWLVKAVPSRVDVCVDLPGVAVGEFVSMVQADRFVCRAVGDQIFREYRKPTGWKAGENVQVRIYDKLREVRKAGDGAKLEVLESKRWGGRVKCATRVEFQLRREPLRELFSVDTVGQLFERLPQICEYLSKEWLRFTTDSVDRDNKHQGRSVVDPLWSKVQQAFQAWTGAVVESIQRRVKPVPSVSRLLVMAKGCLEKASAVLGEFPPSVGAFLASSVELLAVHCGDSVERIGQKMDELCASVPPNFFPPELATL